MKSIQFAKDLAFPRDVVTQKLAFLARSGAGKSYACGVLVEGLLELREQVVVVDPVGVWWALRLDKDGKSKGFDIPVLGGEHGDMPLDPSVGAHVASLVAERGLSLVLDVSDMNGAEQRRFVEAFAIALHKLKKANRSPVLVVWEECQDFVPQRVMGDQARMVGAMERLIKQGRNFGVGTALISQRPQAVNKDVLNQTEVLVVLQTTGPQERKAIDGWVEAHGLDDTPLFDGGTNLSQTLPRLPIGTALVWSPQWLRTFKRVDVGKKRTFDASSTPTAATRTAEPRELQPVDMAELRKAMEATIQEAKDNDPKELRARIVALEKELKAARAAPARVERVEVPLVSSEAIDEVHGLKEAINAERKSFVAMADLMEQAAQVVNGLELRLFAEKTRVRGVAPAATRNGQGAARSSSRAAPRVSSQNAAARADFGSGERAVLISVAQNPEGATRELISLLTGYKRSTRDAYIQRLATRCMVEPHADVITVTQLGVDALGGDYELLPTGDALREHWLAKLPEGERRIFELVCDAHPDPVSRESLSESSGYKRSTRDAYLQRLATRRLIESVGRGAIRASSVLFDGARG